MRLRVDREIFERFPGVRIGALVARGIDNTAGAAEIRGDFARAQRMATERLAGAVLVEHPRVAPWRDAYRAFGAKPKKHRSSIENLLRRVASGEALRSINPLVDIYNTVSLDHLLPVGGEDLASIEGDLELVFAGPDELPVTLLGDPHERSPNPGEVIYRDRLGAVCRRWNWKEAARTKLTEETRDALLVIEALPPVEDAELEAALGDLAGRIEAHCGGRVVCFRLGSDRGAVEIARD